MVMAEDAGTAQQPPRAAVRSLHAHDANRVADISKLAA
jgi:hypothetical protein